MAKKKFYESKAMLNSNKSEVANMPQDVKYHAWPSPMYGLDSRLDDTIMGINEQMSADMAGARRHNKPTKY